MSLLNMVEKVLTALINLFDVTEALTVNLTKLTRFSLFSIDNSKLFDKQITV